MEAGNNITDIDLKGKGAKLEPEGVSNNLRHKINTKVYTWLVSRVEMDIY